MTNNVGSINITKLEEAAALMGMDVESWIDDMEIPGLREKYDAQINVERIARFDDIKSEVQEVYVFEYNRRVRNVREELRNEMFSSSEDASHFMGIDTKVTSDKNSNGNGNKRTRKSSSSRARADWRVRIDGEVATFTELSLALCESFGRTPSPKLGESFQHSCAHIGGYFETFKDTWYEKYHELAKACTAKLGCRVQIEDRKRK